VHLRAGDVLVLVNGEYVVVEKVQHELLESPVQVYNFQVEDYHTYYVAESGVLVHNECQEKYNHGDNTGTGRAPKQGDPNSTYTQVSSDGKGTVVSKTTSNEYSMQGTRSDFTGRAHNGIETPHVHVYSYTEIQGIARRVAEMVISYRP